MTEPTTALALRTEDDGPRAIVPRNFAEAKEMAEYLGKSGLLPAAMRTGPAAVFAIIAAGAELRFPPMASLRAFYIDDRTGTPRLWAEAQAAAVVSRPDVCEYLYPVEQNATRAVWVTKRRGHPAEVRSVFDMEQAIKAGLVDKNGNGPPTRNGNPSMWTKWGPRMFSARAKSNLLRDIYPDIVGGLLTEYDDVPDEPEKFERPIPPALDPAVPFTGVDRTKDAPRRKPKEPPTQRTDSTGLVEILPTAEDAKLDATDRASGKAVAAGTFTPPPDVAAKIEQSKAIIDAALTDMATPRTMVAPAATSHYEASAARVEAAVVQLEQDDDEMLFGEPMPPSEPPQLTAFRAALAAVVGGREEKLIDADLMKLRADVAASLRGPSTDGKIPAGAMHAHAAEFKAAYLARCTELGVSGGQKGPGK